MERDDPANRSEFATEEEQDSFLCGDEAVEAAESVLAEPNEEEIERPLDVGRGSFLLLVSESGQEFGPLIEACYESFKTKATSELGKNAEMIVFGPSGREVPDFASSCAHDLRNFERLAAWYRSRQVDIYEGEIKTGEVSSNHRDVPPCLVVIYGLSDRQLFCQPQVKDFVGNLREVKCALVVTSTFQLEIPWEQRSKVTGLACSGVENNKILSHLWTQFGNVMCTESEFSRLVSRREIWTYLGVGKHKPCDVNLRVVRYGPSSGKTTAFLAPPRAPVVLFRFDKGKPKDARLTWINSCLQWHYETCELNRRCGSPLEFFDEEKAGWRAPSEDDKNCLFAASDSYDDRPADEDLARRKNQYAARRIMDVALRSTATAAEYEAFDRTSMGSWIESQKTYEYPRWTSLL